jgi:transmembrane sensor
LSNGSRIVLNANSHLKFSSAVKNGLRTEVWLEGEAWFDITHFKDEHLVQTFVVQTTDGMVEVLGTRFAVKTFENETRAVLEEGSILVKTNHQANAGRSGEDRIESGVLLQPGEKALISGDKSEISVEKVNPWIYMSWGDEMWTFEDTSVKEIALRIEETFGLEVQVKQELAERRLSGTIRSTNIDVINEALAKILNVKIEKQGDTLFISIDAANRTDNELMNN